MLPIDPAMLLQEDVFVNPPFRECHAATIEESRGSLVVAWFAGTVEGASNVGIWLSRKVKGRWESPREVLTAKDAQGQPVPCWNPVLFQPRRGPLLLFYKAGPDPMHWWGMMTSSPDGGGRWLKPVRLPPGIVGPVKNRPLELPDGTLLCPSSSEDKGWRVRIERTPNLGRSWTTTGWLNDGLSIQAIQPCLLDLGKGRVKAVGRTQQDKVFQIDSGDSGRSWGPMALGQLPNNNSGLDGTKLKDGRYVLAFNNVPRAEGQWSGRRSPLNLAVSPNGADWTVCLTLEDESDQEFSYPSVVQSKDGLIHVVYTWKRQTIRHVTIDPHKLPH